MSITFTKLPGQGRFFISDDKDVRHYKERKGEENNGRRKQHQAGSEENADSADIHRIAYVTVGP